MKKTLLILLLSNFVIFHDIIMVLLIAPNLNGHFVPKKTVLNVSIYYF